MNASPEPSQRRTNRQPGGASKRGIALISVLTVVTLATILVLTFFTLARNEMVASVNYSDGLHAKHLSETAVNMVIGQIRRATDDTDRVWASQPGAIRTYNINSGTFEAAYKLYSSGRMVENATGPAGEQALVEDDYDALSDWSSRLWKYADLNEPVIRGDRIYYPIVDPRARDFPEWDNPRDFDDAGVEGFDWHTNGMADSPMKDALQELGYDALPMPVEWIYQLEDGTLGFLDDSLKFTAFGTGGTATKDNPIVGRIAFWTDDETCKSNVNTHAGGSAWDTPRAGGQIDRDLGRFQPAQREFQRYKGHPATTNLAPVLFPGMKNIQLNRLEMERIFRLVPRVVGGGSESGTKLVDPNDPTESNGLIPDKDRLYPSLDDFILQPGGDRGYDHTNPNVALGTRAENEFPRLSGGQEVDEMLEQARFFLTVSSRAPETNLFNMPRISIWPTYYATTSQEVEQRLTPFDRVIRFCAQLGEKDGEPNRYYFQRRNEDSTTADWDQIERNRELYAYLDRLTDRPVPGYGASFDSKFGRENRLQLLTQIFDYIRSTNLFDDTVYDHADPGNLESWKAAFSNDNNAEHLTFTNYRTNSERGLHMGHGQVAPIHIDYNGVETKGFGRFYTLDEAAIQIICCADGRNGGGGPPVGPVNDTVGNGEMVYSNFPPLPIDVKEDDEATWPAWLKSMQTTHPDQVELALNPENWNWTLAWAAGHDPSHSYDRGTIPKDADLRCAPDERVVQGIFLMELFSPSAGWTPIQPDMMINVEFNGLTLNGGIGQGRFDELGGFGDQYRNGEVPASGSLWVCNRLNFSAVWGGRNYGGGAGFRPLMRGIGIGADPPARHRVYIKGGLSKSGGVQPDYHHGWASGRRAWFDRSAAAGSVDATNIYPFITQPFKINTDSIAISGGPALVTFLVNREEDPSADKGGNAQATRFTSDPKAGPEIVQTIELDLSSLSGMPAPDLAGGTREFVNEFNAIYSRETSPMDWWSASFDGINPLTASHGRMAGSNRVPHGVGQYIRPTDSVWSMVLPHGDGRLTAGLREIPHPSSTVEFVRHPAAGGGSRFGHSLTIAVGGNRFDGVTGANITKQPYPGGKKPLPIPGGDGVRDATQLYGDFDNGQGGTIDGAYINKVDEGNTHSLRKRTYEPTAGSWEWRRDYGSYPYFVREWTHEAAGPAYFSPNRMMPSPGVFGSMPNMVLNNAGVPNQGAWQTLLFRPNVVGNGYSTHPGAESPPDHMFLDLFWMPVVEPYAISEPSSTAGRVNMNYQILPFTNITRTSALRGVFQSEYMLCIPNKHVRNYKVGVGRGRGYHWLYRPYQGELQSLSLRSVIVEHETLKQFEEKFDDAEIFLTASEICDIHLIPQDIGERQGFANATGTFTPTLAQMQNGDYWEKHQVVGDNGREAPYSHILPRLTTKSNTFQVHVRSQVVKKARGTEPDIWDPELDTVVAEYRGSAIVERYIEPNDPEIPDYATVSAPPTLDLFYKFRVVNEKRFSP